MPIRVFLQCLLFALYLYDSNGNLDLISIGSWIWLFGLLLVLVGLFEAG